MRLNIRYKKPLEEVHQGTIEMHKNAKGYNIQIDGKFYFPHRDNPVLEHLEELKDKELWVAITKDEISYGTFTFAAPDFFVRINEEEKSVEIEKEIPLNQIDNPDDPFKWDYVVIAKCKTVDETDTFIDKLEDLKVPEKTIKNALDEFYAMQ